MSATNFNTRNDTFRKLMGNGLTYRIPRFQRDFSWTDDEWEDLWQDILGTIKPGGEPAHYMGYLVLQSENDKSYDVIDGQQRLTTLSIIVLAAMKNLQRLIDSGKNPEQSKQRLDQLRQAYIGYLDPVTLVSQSKLTLNRNNDHYYQNYIVPLSKLPQRNLKSTEHLLRKAFEWFDKHIGDYIKGIEEEPGKALAELIETMSDRLFFTVISVTDELNAYKVFETLNARGVRLSATDLLKNYLFSVLHKQGQHEHEMKNLEYRWESIVGRLGSESFPDFLRVHWNSRHSFVRQTDLFKTIRSEITSSERAFQLIREMEEDVDTFLALTQPEISRWNREWIDYANHIRMFNVRQPYPLLMAAKRCMNDADFEDLLRGCMIISLRYNVIGNQPTSEQERVYNQVSEKVSKGMIQNARDALILMRSIYPSDEAFRTSFTEKTIKTTQSRNNRVVRYILCQLEKQLSGIDHDFESDAFTIEHILPQNPESGWDAFSESEQEPMTYRIGNMTLLEKDRNKDMGNSDYPIKRDIYNKSNFLITRKISEENKEWNPERIANRQKGMARQAISIWRINQLS